MKRLLVTLLGLLTAGALVAQTTHPPTMLSASLPTCNVSRDGTLVSLTDASTTLDCNTTGGGSVTATCKCEQQSAGVFTWIGVATGAHTVDTTGTDTLDDLSDNDLGDLQNVTEVGEAAGRALVGNAGGGWEPSADEVCLQDGTNCPAAGASNSFETISTTSGTAPVADSATDTLALTAGTGITITGDSATDTVTIASTAAGDVVGPASATDECFARFDLTTGKLLQDSVVCATDLGVVTGLTRLDVDNLRSDGNALSATNANGVISLLYAGTGRVQLGGTTSAFAALDTFGTGGLRALRADGSALVDNFYVANVNAAITLTGSVYKARMGNLGTLYGVGVSSDAQFAFGSSTDGMYNLLDAGIARDGVAGRLRITDGGSGTGNLKAAKYISAAQAFSIADDGAGTKAAGTLTPASSYVECSCLDADGCTVTVSETGALTGQIVHIVTISAAACEYADSAGVTELAGAFVAGTDDALSLMYGAAQWRELSRSNN